jgi:hypothetical protein
MPHDIDFVADAADSDAPRQGSSCSHKERTAFGGLTFSGESIDIDLWFLHETYLIRHFRLAPDLANLLAIVDFNINAVLFLPRQLWESPTVHDGGCREAISLRSINFHFEWLPLPIAQVARLVYFLAKHGLDLSDSVRRFVRAICDTENRVKEIKENLGQNCPREHLDEARKSPRFHRRREENEIFWQLPGRFSKVGASAPPLSAGAYHSSKRCWYCV